MKQLAVLLVFLLAIALVVGAHFAIDHYRSTNEHTPPVDQIAESVDAPPQVDQSDGVGAERSGRWSTVRKHYIEDHPVCEACGSSEDLNVHHVKPFHVHPELELDPENLVTLCREHHFHIGHDPDGPDGPRNPNWKLSNPNVRSDARKYRDSLSLTP